MESIVSQIIFILTAIFYLSENTVLAQNFRNCGLESHPCCDLFDDSNDGICIEGLECRAGICLSDCIPENMVCSLETNETRNSIGPQSDCCEDLECGPHPTRSGLSVCKSKIMNKTKNGLSVEQLKKAFALFIEETFEEKRKKDSTEEQMPKSVDEMIAEERKESTDEQMIRAFETAANFFRDFGKFIDSFERKSCKRVCLQKKPFDKLFPPKYTKAIIPENYFCDNINKIFDYSEEVFKSMERGNFFSCNRYWSL